MYRRPERIIEEGRINIPKFQYDLMHPSKQRDFLPIFGKQCVMYRHKDAPDMARIITYTDVDREDGFDWFKVLVNEFMQKINDTGVADWIEGDEDFEFTYGALCTALATIHQSETDWLLTRMFGTTYELRKVDLNNDSEYDLTYDSIEMES